MEICCNLTKIDVRETVLHIWTWNNSCMTHFHSSLPGRGEFKQSLSESLNSVIVISNSSLWSSQCEELNYIKAQHILPLQKWSIREQRGAAPAWRTHWEEEPKCRLVHLNAGQSEMHSGKKKKEEVGQQREREEEEEERSWGLVWKSCWGSCFESWGGKSELVFFIVLFSPLKDWESQRFWSISIKLIS